VRYPHEASANPNSASETYIKIHHHDQRQHHTQHLHLNHQHFIPFYTTINIHFIHRPRIQNVRAWGEYTSFVYSAHMFETHIASVICTFVIPFMSLPTRVLFAVISSYCFASDHLRLALLPTDTHHCCCKLPQVLTHIDHLSSSGFDPVLVSNPSNRRSGLLSSRTPLSRDSATKLPGSCYP
jgi:hypothetical protein